MNDITWVVTIMSNIYGNFFLNCCNQNFFFFFQIILFKTRPTHRRTDANLYPPEKKLTKASEPSFDLEGGAKGQI